MRLIILIVGALLLLSSCRPGMSQRNVPNPASWLAVQDGDATRRLPATLIPGTRRVVTRCFPSSRFAVYAVFTASGQRLPVDQNLGCLEPLHLQVLVLAGRPTAPGGNSQTPKPQAGDGVLALSSEPVSEGKLGAPAETSAGEIFPLEGDIAKLEAGQAVGNGSRRPLGAAIERDGRRFLAPFTALAALEPRLTAPDETRTNSVPTIIFSPVPNPAPAPAPAPATVTPVPQPAKRPPAPKPAPKPDGITIKIDASIPFPRIWK